MTTSGSVQAHGGTYEYEVTWNLAGDLVLWDAKVRRDGSLKGTPNGTIAESSQIPDVESLVRQYVENSIRLRVGIDE